MEEEEKAKEGKTQKESISDPESGWFHKGEHKSVFAYAVETTCDCHGWILGYSVHPGNEHDSRTFKTLYDKVRKYAPDMMVLDSGFRTPAIAYQLLEDGIDPLFPYKRPQTKDGFLRNTIMLMMNISIVTFVQRTKFCDMPRQAEKDIENIKVTVKNVKTVPT